MLTIAHTTCTSSSALLDEARHAARHYGFLPLEETFSVQKQPLAQKDPLPKTFVHPHDRALAALTKHIVERQGLDVKKPRLFYTLKHIPASKTYTFGLHAVGMRDAVAEALLIGAAHTFTTHVGVTAPLFTVSSIGNADSYKRYHSELSRFLHNYIDSLSTPMRDDLTSGNAIRAFIRLREKAPELAAQAPAPMEFLDDESRLHFRNLLEYLEAARIPYDMDAHLTAHGDFWTHALFELYATHDGTRDLLARGGRAHAGKHFKRPFPHVSLFFDIEDRGRAPKMHADHLTPRLYLAQLGTLAKQSSLALMHDLHTAGIPVHHSLAAVSIGEQLIEARSFGVPYIIIVGHKEAMEHTALVRTVETGAQVEVPLAQLTTYLKRLK